MGLATSVAYPARLKTLSKALSSSKNRVLRLADGQGAAGAHERRPRRSSIGRPYRQALSSGPGLRLLRRFAHQRAEFLSLLSVGRHLPLCITLLDLHIFLEIAGA